MAETRLNAVPIRHNRHSDRADKASKRHIARLAFLLAGVLIVLASVSLFFVGLIASREADKQASAYQQQLLDITLKNRFSLMMRDQLSLARWDVSVRRISHDFDRAFVTDEFVDSLWFDFGIDRNLLVDPAGTIIAESLEDDVSFNHRKLNATGPLNQLVDRARTHYLDNRIPVPGGYGQRPISQPAAANGAATGFLAMGAQVVVASAMAIVPDDGDAVLPDGTPVVLISAVHIDQGFISNLNDQLSFSDLDFIRFPPSSPIKGEPLHQIVSPGGEVLGAFTWSSATPGRHIWITVIPVIVVLGSFLALAAFGIAWKTGNLTIALAASEKHSYYLAMHDTLSGLANRLQFNRALDAAVQDLPGTHFTLIQGDLDRFKKVNDTLGHAAGDTVIKTVAERLSFSVYSVDSAGLVGRIGGDEFVILLPDCADYTQVRKLADSIVASICLPIETDSGEL
ncbi:MAG TPA: diguanylate cyclase, partial [Desulfopila sp.]|nr:diguanylate cyclase [Desulfopila sp.]